MVFINSMSDTFHESVPFDYIQRIIKMIRETPQHTYQILTKRAHRLLKRNAFIDWPDNLWMGVSVENSQAATRIPKLQRTDAKTKFLSLEPLIGPINQLTDPHTKRWIHDYLEDIDWVIIGGESGSQARPMKETWATDLVYACQSNGTKVFVKQMGSHWAKQHNSKSWKGENFNEFPESLQIREYPT